MDNELYLSVRQVAARCGVSRDSIYRWKRAGNFPSSVIMSSGTTRWRLSDIVAWEGGLTAGFMTHHAFTPTLAGYSQSA